MVLFKTRGAPRMGVKRRCPPCVHFSALSSKMRGCRSFKPVMRVRFPSRRPFSLRKRRLLIRNRSSFLPHRIFTGACRQPEPAGANLRAWRRSNAAVCQSAVPGAIPGARTMELWCQQSAQRTFNPQSAGATPAGSTILYPWSLRADDRRSLPAPSDLSRGFSRRARAAKGPACKVGITAGATPAVVSNFHGAVMIIAACRARNADETERNRPAPPLLPGRC